MTQLTRLSTAFLLWLALSLTAAAQPVATLEPSSVTIMEGTPRVSIPLHLDAEETEADDEEVIISGFYSTVQLEPPDIQAAFIRADDPTKTPEEFVGSIFTKEAGKTIQRIDNHSPTRIGLLLIEWVEPFGQIEANGLVAILNVDTSKLKAGRYTINPGASGLTSATFTKDGLMWHVLRIRPILGTITVRPKQAE